MITTFYILSSLTMVVSLLPLVPNKHWFFRIFEFLKIQILAIQIVTLLLGAYLCFSESSNLIYVTEALLLLFIAYHLYALFPFTIFYKWLRPPKNIDQNLSKPIKLISSNVYQFNTNHDKLLQLIESEKPDLVLTMESDSKWEKALRSIEKDFPYHVKETLDNTYGMHFYSKLKIEEEKINFFIHGDIPCFEIRLKTEDGFTFDFYGVHPPPPSPTEEENSKERDGDLMCLSKIIDSKKQENVVVVGDFNNVAWADSTKRFRRLTGLIDPRFGRGFISTFHAKYPFLRMPIDLMYHSGNIFVKSFSRLSSINSDHFPLSCIFQIGEYEIEKSEETPEEGDYEQREIDIQERKEQVKEKSS